MPNKPGGLTKNIAESMDGVLIAIRRRELEDGEVHLPSGGLSSAGRRRGRIGKATDHWQLTTDKFHSISSRYSSIRGLLRKRWHAWSSCRRAVSLSLPCNSISRYLPTCTASTPL